MPSVDSFPAPSADGHHANRVVLEMHSDSVAIVSLVGEHDLGHYEQLKDAFDTAAVRRRNLVVDLSGCAFIDSTVISLLLYAQREITSDGGRFVVVIHADAGSVARVAEMARLFELVPVYASLATAVESAQSFSIARRGWSGT